MSKRKAIVDSDDEDEGEMSPSKSVEENYVDGVHLDASPTPESVESAVPSATSTEKLKYEIHEAHRNLLEQTPSVQRTGRRSMSATTQHPQELSAIAESRSRRAKTATEVHNSRNKAHVLFDFHGGSDCELEASPRKKRKRNRTQEETVGTDRTPSYEHLSLAGSTVNAPESAMLPPPPRCNTKKKVRLSQMSTTPTQPNTSPHETPHKDPTSAEQEGSQGQGLDASRSFSSGAFPSNFSPNDACATQKTLATDEDALGENDQDELDEPCPTFYTSGSTRPMVILHEQEQVVAANDHSAASNPFPEPSDASVSTMRKKEKVILNHYADDLSSDDNAIGFPKDKYKPRPSRSRGRRDDEDLTVPIDFSKRPEVSAKSKKKQKSSRSKTTAFFELMPKGEDENEDEEQSLPEKPELAIPTFKSKKEEASDEQKQGLEDTSPKKIDSGKTPKKQRGRPKKGADSKPAENDKQDDQSALAPTESRFTEPENVTAAKRGRPSNKSLSIAEREDNDPTAALDKENVQPPNVEVDAPDETDNVPITSKTPEKSEKSEKAAETTMTKQSPGTPQKSPAEGPKAPDKHSPISTGKVSYRVGLSKRARIAPLLRMVRK